MTKFESGFKNRFGHKGSVIRIPGMPSLAEQYGIKIPSNFGKEFVKVLENLKSEQISQSQQFAQQDGIQTIDPSQLKPVFLGDFDDKPAIDQTTQNQQDEQNRQESAQEPQKGVGFLGELAKLAAKSKPADSR